MTMMASQITSLTIVYSAVYSGADQRKHQSPASLAFMRGIHRWPVNSPRKGTVTRKMFPFDDVIMYISQYQDWAGTGEDKFKSMYLNNFDLVTPNGSIHLGQHWFRQWLVAWRPQAITWPNVDFLGHSPKNNFTMSAQVTILCVFLLMI